MSTKIAAVVGRIVEELEGLTTEERKRAIAGSLAILGESALQSFAPSREHVDKGADEAGEHAQHEHATHVSPPGMSWIKKNHITQEQVEEIFHIEDGKVTLILGEAIGKSKRQQTINTYILTGAAAMLATGIADFTDDVGRQNCIIIGCYDAPNHGKYIKEFGNKITGSKTSGWKLTAPGLTAAAALLKRENSVKE
jgi:hypothetical protein